MENEKKQLTKEEKRREIFRAVKYTLFAASAGIIEFGSFTLLTLIPELNPELNHSIYWIPGSSASTGRGTAPGSHPTSAWTSISTGISATTAKYRTA